MSGICESLVKANIAVDCDGMSVKGLEEDGLIINRKHIDFAKTVFDETNKNIIKTLVLKKTFQAYSVVGPGATPFTGTKTTMKAGTYRNTFESEIPIVILDNGPSVSSDIIDGLANGTFVVILKNKHKGTNGKSEYQMFGYYQGLNASAIENDKYAEDTEGGWKVTLKESGAPKSAMFYYNTDSTTTETQFESLKTAVAA